MMPARPDIIIRIGQYPLVHVLVFVTTLTITKHHIPHHVPVLYGEDIVFQHRAPPYKEERRYTRKNRPLDDFSYYFYFVSPCVCIFAYIDGLT